MGLLVDGVWKDQWYDTSETGGKFERSAAKFRNWVTADGSAGATGDAVSKPLRDGTIFTSVTPAPGRTGR